ncbi:hypothetical protein MHF_0836 [Mycoplasma haemofelis Ohio2]|uniref:Uncharacterized protein n=1 Tax=Mycoplasma haemofelis (strain Ohio2) TaxID=859194 RepID=F6FIQ2_MYCHI|nr:hypothetical protein MHF_0836 [Mycoplasma haemofelis Ohio2]
MPILLPLKIAIGGIAGAAVVSGLLFGGVMLSDYVDFSSDEKGSMTVREKFGDLLLNTTSYDADVWSRRKNKLDEAIRGGRFAIFPDVRLSADGSQIMQWCNSRLDDQVLWESDALYLNVKKFCTKDIRDTFSKGELIEKDGDWTKAKERLNKGTLPNSMSQIKSNLNTPNQNSLEEYCTSSYETPFDPKDERYLNVKNYCTTVKD